MNLLAIVLALLGIAFASNAAEAAAIFKIDAADSKCQEIGELIAPHLFQNTFESIFKDGDVRLINAEWRFKINSSQYWSTKDYYSQLSVEQVVYVYNEQSYGLASSKPAFKITHKAHYRNVLKTFDERSESRNHVFTLNNGSLTITPA